MTTSTLTPLRPAALREPVHRLTARVEQTILHPADPTPLDERLRLLLALRTAMVNDDAGTATRLAAMAGAVGRPGDVLVAAEPRSWNELGTAGEAVLEYGDQVAQDPSDIDAGDIARLRSRGVPDAAIVGAVQTVAYVSYRARLEHGLRLLTGAPSLAAALPEPALRRTLPDKATAFPVLTWKGWVAPGEMPPEPDGRMPRRTPFYLTLAHEPEILAARTALYTEIMAGEGHLPLAERELVALATSLVTGCEYCASVHGRRHAQLSHDRQTAVRLAAEGPDTLQAPRDRALVAFAARNALTPTAVSRADVVELEDLGLTPGEIADVIAVSSLFAWANRLMMTLGAPA